MSILTESPSPNKIDETGAELLWGDDFRQELAERAARELENAWPLSSLAADGAEEPAASPEPEGRGDEVEIDGRTYEVRDRLGIDQLPARAAAMWQRKSVVAHVEVRRPRGRTSYIARQYVDGRYSKPWPGALTTH